MIADEAQFLAPEQIDQPARVVDDLGLDVHAFGVTTDFRSELFPARSASWSRRTGARATHNARTLGGEMVVEGAQVVVGDVNQSADEIGYEVPCRHHRRCVTAATARTAALSPGRPAGVVHLTPHGFTRKVSRAG